MTQARSTKGTPMSSRTIIKVIAGCALPIALAACASKGTAELPGSASPSPSTTVEAPKPAEAGAKPRKAERPAATKPAPEAPSKPAPRPAPERDTNLANGYYPTLLKEVHPSQREIVVDVVELIHDDAARKAAKAAGEEYYKFYEMWIQNRNPLLRTLPVAEGVEIEGFTGACEDTRPVASRLKGLEAELKAKPEIGRSPYVLWITVRGGVVRTMKLERQHLFPAC
jgi:hypothetical protein